jgi:ABC-type antimicrobial peptide transport system permease subunit
VYGVIARAVARRRQEIGIRMALGADARRIVRLVLQSGLGLALAGVGAGVVGALARTRALSSLLYGVSASDPLVFTTSALSLFVMAIVATYVPAHRATRIDPGVTLRSE